jgi:hypothetical protein
MQMADSKLFFGGIPVRPDVEKLMKSIAIEAGRLVTHSEIVRVLRLDPKSSRYRTVVTSWRKTIEREKFLRLDGESGVGYRVLTPEQAISRSAKDIEHVSNASRKTTVRIEMIDTMSLSDQSKDQHALVRRHAHMINDTCRQVRKEIAAPSPTASAVRLVK